MEDERVWTHEKRLWTGSGAEIAGIVDPSCLMVVPAAPFLMEGEAALQAMDRAPRWTHVDLAHGRIVRPQDGLIVVAYKAFAQREDGEEYNAWCTSTYRRAGHDDWHLVQHQQMQAADGPLRSG